MLRNLNYNLFENDEKTETQQIKPFLKWAGGKSQLLSTFIKFYPAELKQGKIQNYYEPFIGGGAVFFHIRQNFPIEKFYLMDINPELILMYQVIQKNPMKLIKILSKMSDKYKSLGNEERKAYFYEIREKLNTDLHNLNLKSYHSSFTDRAALLIFLNKTCFNGLYRVNSKGEFNVPYGDYKNPKIFDCNNIIRTSELLQGVIIKRMSFIEALEDIKPNSFIYLDPPYRPLNRTSSFKSYTKESFDDEAQIKLAERFKELSKRRDLKLMLSNSDPKNENPNDDFFERAYFQPNVYISKVQATRMINSDASKRGEISELIIRNYT